MSLLCGKKESRKGKRDKSPGYGQAAEAQPSVTSTNPSLSEQDLNRLTAYGSEIKDCAKRIKATQKKPDKRRYEDPYNACADEAFGVLKVLKREVADPGVLASARRELDDIKGKHDDLDDELRKADNTLRKRDRELDEHIRSLEKARNENERLRKEVEQARSEPRSPTITASVTPCQKCSLYRQQIENMQQSAASPTSRSPPAHDEENRRLRTNLENAIRDAEKERNEKNTTLSRISHENETLQRTNEELRRQIEKLKAARSDSVDGEKNINALQLNFSRVEGELHRIKAEKETLEKTLGELKRQNEKLRAAPPPQNDEAWKEVDQLKQELKRKDDDIERLRIERDSVVRLESENQQRRSAQPTHVPDTGKQVEQLQHELRRKDEEIHQLQQNIMAMRGLKDDLAQSQRLLQASERNKENLEKEKDNLLTRLSAVASSRLRDNNPAITDLSDPNRPLKLGEKMSELYDNEWTNAMEEMENISIEEQKGLTILLHILQETYSVCKETAEKQLSEIQSMMVHPPSGFDDKDEDIHSRTSQGPELRQAGYRPVDRHSVSSTWINKGPVPFGAQHHPQVDTPSSPTSPSAPVQKATSRIPLPRGKTIEPKHSHIPVRSPSSSDQNGESTPKKGDKEMNSQVPKPSQELMKQAKDFRKMEAVAEEAITTVGKIVQKKLDNREDMNAEILGACKEYINKCVELCWLMQIQDPPVVLFFNAKEGDEFNGDIWRSYTKSGTSVEYVVWPAMYLSDGGAMLCKGVAQGRK